jgi:hypothetical protein
MGGERASKTRMRLEGRICAICSRSLDLPEKSGERVCSKCEEQRKPKRNIYMHFMRRDSWHCQFVEADLKTPLPRKVTLDDPRKIIEMAKRGGAPMKLQDIQALEYAIQTGRGSVILELTDEQYQKLKLR